MNQNVTFNCGVDVRFNSTTDDGENKITDWKSIKLKRIWMRNDQIIQQTPSSSSSSSSINLNDGEGGGLSDKRFRFQSENVKYSDDNIAWDEASVMKIKQLRFHDAGIYSCLVWAEINEKKISDTRTITFELNIEPFDSIETSSSPLQLLPSSSFSDRFDDDVPSKYSSQPSLQSPNDWHYENGMVIGDENIENFDDSFETDEEEEEDDEDEKDLDDQEVLTIPLNC